MWFKVKNDRTQYMFNEIFLMRLCVLLLSTWQLAMVLFKGEIKKAERHLEELRNTSYPNPSLNFECIFLNLYYPSGFFKSYVHFLFRGVAGTCSGNQGCWWIQPRLSLPGVEWLCLLSHKAVCTDSLVGPGSGKDQSRKKSVQPTIYTQGTVHKISRWR